MADQNQQSLLLGKIAAYTEILVKDPNSTIFVSLAETYRKMGMLDDSQQIISKGLELHVDFSPAHIVLARALCQLEDFDGSVAAFERALELDEESLAALVGYARVKILLGDELSARELLLRARNLSPADSVINKLLLSLPEEIEVVTVESEDAAVQVEDTAEKPTPLVSSTLAELYLAQGLTEKALDLFQRLSEKNPDDLTLRRKIKELEGEISAETVTIIEQPAIEPFEPEPESDELPESEGMPVETANDPSGDTVLTTFNSWLSNIKQRRGNV